MTCKTELRNRLTISKSESELVIKRKWFTLKSTLFCIAGFIYFLLSMKIFFSFNIISEDHFVLLITYLLSASLLAYMIIAGWLNGTRIVLDQDLLEIEQWPVPFPGKRRILASEITYLYIRNNINLDIENTRVNYEVHALTLGGRDMKIIDGLKSACQAGRVKKNIDSFLNLVDIPSSGHALSLCH